MRLLLPRLVCRALNKLFLLFTLGAVWSVCRNRRYWKRRQADVCWHDVLDFGQIQFWTQPTHQGKQRWHEATLTFLFQQVRSEYTYGVLVNVYLLLLLISSSAP